MEWHYGDPGLGKSRRAAALYPEAYWKICSNKWWDGYSGEEVVIMDDMEHYIASTHLKRWWDRYPCHVEVKGGTVPLKATRFVCTSNFSIEQIARRWFPHDEQRTEYSTTLLALKRRISIYREWRDETNCVRLINRLVDRLG